jgi:hypothetical protein
MAFKGAGLILKGLVVNPDIAACMLQVRNIQGGTKDAGRSATGGFHTDPASHKT